MAARQETKALCETPPAEISPLPQHSLGGDPLEDRAPLRLKFARKRKAILDEYLAKDRFHGLHIGCGPHCKDGWINTDVLVPRLPWTPVSENEAVRDFPLDLTEPLPFPDESLDAIYGEHVIEHIEKDDAIAIFREARRALKPGGILRLATPDLDGTCRTYLRLDDGVYPEASEPYRYEDEWGPEFRVNATFRYRGHLFIWNFRPFEQELTAAGFASRKADRAPACQRNPRQRRKTSSRTARSKRLKASPAAMLSARVLRSSARSIAVRCAARSR